MARVTGETNGTTSRPRRQRQQQQQQQQQQQHRPTTEDTSSSPSRFYPTLPGWTPTSAHDAELYRRFHKEPPTTPLQITLNGVALELPKYNGIGWWFPDHKPLKEQHPVEIFFFYVFTGVNTMQTISLLVVPIQLLVQYGVWRGLASLLLTIPLGSYLEERFGDNYGSAYTSLVVLELAWGVMGWSLELQQQRQSSSSTTTPNRLVVVFAFGAALYGLGVGLCWIERHVLGRTFHAAFVAYGQLGYWMWKLIVSFLLL
jgi:hypothetical protein